MSQYSDSDTAPKVRTPVQARQGFLGRPVLVVLIVSVGLAALAMIATFMGFW